LFHVKRGGFLEGVQQVLSLEMREIADIYVLQEWKPVLRAFQLMQILPLNPNTCIRSRVGNFSSARCLGLAGLLLANVSPETESTHSPSM
jgi:hypothetical protein